ncbi:MAG TPA: tRNA lysidine(34) synthetase TilS [Firmicutes bacterium]|jgi:tRNA(Ile)-lysidine synthase|nr:tRNA lysidine(34) synthetase TilS [Bacillota bacterium]
MDAFEGKVLAAIQRYQMFSAGNRVLVAVSGGVDSMVLLAVLMKIPLRLRLAVFHLNHRLRPESEAEAELVASFASAHSLPCYIERLADDLHTCKGKKSLQVAAREVRYRLMDATADRLGMEKIALGHHADDQVETVLMRFLTGAGPEGLAGIPPVRGRYVRPLLEVSREEIMAYARQANLSWAEDASNQKPVYLRNRLRHGLLPYLEEEYQPGLRGRLRETALICREWIEVLEDLVGEVLQRWGVLQPDGKLAPNREGGYLTPVAAWLELPPAVQRVLFRRLFFSLAPADAYLEFIHSEAFLRLVKGPTGKEINLPGGLLAVKEETVLWLGLATAVPVWGSKVPEDWGPLPLMVPGTTVLPANQGVVETKWLGRGDLPPTWEQVSPFEFYLDADRFTFPLYLRPRRPGDRFTPLGLGGSKKVKELFIAAKIPRLQRAAYPLLVDGEGRVLGVLGLRPAAQSKITVESRRVLYLNYRRLS